ncbi:sterol desaturase [Mergibacter septicus]|uniref:Sterol desaturase n=1 Tax=Mergibacter septicus TaxID=221402 RepID=A0A8E3S8K5_9PAST|nr:sterol desaturase family protein [Mergibacter septicus]AWX15771.1 sterol desaturase [Mergibacter septicus]QDJ13249.1 sterol desaturase [Mergibacter septicus]QDJ15024.1 sterol desaturase [Mergibacter septicus]UTU47551.1 sterol desaturase family protein [Mergibacter septicus]WMR95267.1 sterol desaturase family protein [Mergibacter septicus]
MIIIDDYLLNPEQRLYWGYLVAALSIAILYYVVSPKPNSIQLKTVFGKAKAYWFHPSATLDYRYFIAVWLIKVYLLLPLLLSAESVALYVNLALQKLHSPLHLALPNWLITLLYTTSLFLTSEFTRYWLHRWLHTVPWLWQFHKVHHSAEILTPLTFYRVHPFENFLFGLRYALTVGIVTGIFLWGVGSGLTIYTIGGANIFIWLMAMLGGNLRHSHIYLRYPKALERWFISPAQHQLHHTYQFAARNYGGYLSIFDRLFNTLQTSENIQQPTQFGFPEKMAKPYRGLIGLLKQPFIDCWQLWKKTK